MQKVNKYLKIISVFKNKYPRTFNFKERLLINENKIPGFAPRRRPRPHVAGNTTEF